MRPNIVNEMRLLFAIVFRGGLTLCHFLVGGPMRWRLVSQFCDAGSELRVGIPIGSGAAGWLKGWLAISVKFVSDISGCSLPLVLGSSSRALRPRAGMVSSLCAQWPLTSPLVTLRYS